MKKIFTKRNIIMLSLLVITTFIFSSCEKPTITVPKQKQNIDNNESPAESIEQIIQRHLDAGIKKLEAKDYKGAIKEFTSMIEKNPKDMNGHLQRGIAYFLLKDKKAEDDLNKVISSSSPKASEAYFYKGKFIFFLGTNTQNKIKEAITNFDKAIEVNKNYAEAYLYRGVANNELKRKFVRSPEEEIKRLYISILKDYNKAIDLNSKYDIAYYYRGIFHSQEFLFEEAIKDFEKALEVTTHNTSSDDDKIYRRGLHKNIGITYYQIAMHSKSLSYDDRIEKCRKALEAYKRASTLGTSSSKVSVVSEEQKILESIKIFENLKNVVKL